MKGEGTDKVIYIRGWIKVMGSWIPIWVKREEKACGDNTQGNTVESKDWRSHGSKE